MNFFDDMLSLPFHIMEKAEFKDRSLKITFKSGNEIIATCPDGNPQYEILKRFIFFKLGPQKVIIHE